MWSLQVYLTLLEANVVDDDEVIVIVNDVGLALLLVFDPIIFSCGQ